MRRSASSCSCTRSRAASPARMTPVHDGDVRNVTVYQHFIALSALTTFAVIGFFPRLA